MATSRADDTMVRGHSLLTNSIVSMVSSQDTHTVLGKRCPPQSTLLDTTTEKTALLLPGRWNYF